MVHAWPFRLNAVGLAFVPEAERAELSERRNAVVEQHAELRLLLGDASGVFTMVAFSEGGHRNTRVFGSRGELRCDGETIEIHDFLTRQTERIPVGDFGDFTAGGGHGGGDARLVAAFVDAVAADDPTRVLSGARDSLASHLTVFAAEDARRTGAVVTVPS